MAHQVRGNIMAACVGNMAFPEFAYLNSFWQLDPILLPVAPPSVPEARMFEDGNTYGPSTQDPPLPNSVARWEQNGRRLPLLPAPTLIWKSRGGKF